MDALKHVITLVLIGIGGNVAFAQGKIEWKSNDYPRGDAVFNQRIEVAGTITPDAGWKIKDTAAKARFSIKGGKQLSINDNVPVTDGVFDVSLSGTPGLKTNTFYNVTVEIRVYEVGNESNIRTIVTDPRP